MNPQQQQLTSRRGEPEIPPNRCFSLPRAWVLPALLCLTIPAELIGKTRVVSVTYDHSSGKLKCGESPVSGPPVCIVKASPKDIISIGVENSLPALFSLEVHKTDRAAVGVPRGALSGTVLAPRGAGVTGGALIATTFPSPPILLAYQELDEQFRNLQVLLNSGNFGSYVIERPKLEKARAALAGVVAPLPYEPKTIANAIKAAVGKLPDMPAVDVDALAARLQEIETFRLTVSVALLPLAPADFQYVDRDFALECVIATTDARFKGGNRTFIIEVQESGGWDITTTTGLAFSRLVDDDYTTKVVVDREATGGMPAVMHTEAVKHRHDALLPEAALFVNFAPYGWKPSLSLGVGVATGATGRIYLGGSYRFGQAAQITLGIAGGREKRLSPSVDRKNLGTVNPHDTRVDEFHTSAFVSLTFHILP